MKDLSITFHIESADKSVGIMSEGFSAWDNNGTEWCDLQELGSSFETSKFEWISNETGEPCKAPDNSTVIEKLLYAFVEHYYNA